MPEISVIMPVYNTDSYLVKSIESVLNQTYTDFELIIVNDGSTDNSLEIISQYAAKDNRIKVITQSNQGQSVARNRALKEVKGNYIAFIDSDDFISSEFLNILHKTAKETKAEVVGCDYLKVRNKDEKLPIFNTSKLSYKLHTEPLNAIMRHIPYSSVIWNKLYKTSILKGRYFIEGIYFEDWPWVVALFADIKSYAEVPCKLYGYNVYGVSTIRSTFTKKKIDDYETGIRFVYDLFCQDKYKQNWRLVQKTRIAASIKMMVNKTYHENKQSQKLQAYLFQRISQMHKEKIFCYRDLELKVLVRLGKMKINKIIKKNISITDTPRHKIIKFFGISFKKRQVKGRRGAEYYWLKEIAKKQRKYPKDSYLLFDSLHDASTELIDAYTLFRYMRSIGLKAYYVIWKKNPLYQKLEKENDLENVIVLNFPTNTHPNEMAKKIQDILVRTKIVITAFSAYSGTMNGFFKRNKYMKYVFIQHGVIFLKESILYNKYLMPGKFDKILTSSKIEYDILRKYNIPAEELLISGLPRWDLLSSSQTTKEKSILLMLTWRRLKPEVFEKSLYYQNLVKLLKNKRLQNCLVQNHVTLYFAPHHHLRFSTSNEWHFEESNVEIIDSCAISQYVKKCSALITDFSSIAFDFMFQHKPVLFYVLDKGDMLPHHYDREDIERFEEKRKILPYVYFDEEKAVNAIIKIINNNFAIDNKTARVYDRFFAVKENICENLAKQLEAMK